MNNDVITELIRNLAAIIDAIAKVLTPVGVIFIGYWAYRSKRQSETNATVLATVKMHSESSATTLKTVSENVNGMSSNLVAATKAAATAQGQLKGRDEERDRATLEG